MHFFYAIYKRYREALIEDQGRKKPSEVPFWRLLVDEFPILARRVGTVKVWVLIAGFFVVVLAVEIALNGATPGPFLSPRWRVIVAVLGTLLFVPIWSLVHAVRRTAVKRRRRA